MVGYMNRIDLENNVNVIQDVEAILKEVTDTEVANVLIGVIELNKIRFDNLYYKIIEMANKRIAELEKGNI